MSAPVPATPVPAPASQGSAAERLARALARVAAQPHADPAERARALLAIALEAAGAESAHLAGADGRVAAALDARGAFSWRDAPAAHEPHPLLDALPGPEDSGAIAVPVHDLAGNAIGALSCGGVDPDGLSPDRIDALTLAALAAAPLLAPSERSRGRLVAEHASDILLEVSPEGIVTWANPALRRVLGIDPREIVGKAGLDHVLPEERERVAAAVAEAVSTPDGHPPIRLRATHRDGSPRWLELTVANALGDPAVGAIVVALRDVTERVAAEDALADEDALLRSVVDALPDHIWVKGPDRRYRMVNRAAAESFGFGAAENAIGGMVHEVYPPAIAAQADDEDGRVLERGETLVGLVRQGTLEPDHWWMTTKVPLRNAAGEVVGLVGISRDVTERKLAEDAARAERDLLQTAIDAIPDPIWVKDRDGRFTRLNRAAIERFRRLGPADPIGRTGADYFDPAFAATVAEQDRATIETGEPMLDALESEAAGSLVRWRLVSKVPLRDADGAVTGLIGIMHDITERKDIEDALAEERDLLMTLLDTLPDPVIVRDLAGRVVRMNRAAVADHGLASDAHALGRPYAELLPPGRAAEVDSADAAMVATGEPVFNDLQHWDGPNGAHWYLVSKAPFHNLDGETIGLVSTYRDITALHAAEQALQAERDQLQVILDAIPDWVFLKDTEGRYLRVNEAFVHDFGLASPAEAVGRTFESFTPANVHEGIRDEDAAAVAAAGGVITQVFGTATPDGSMHTYRLVKRTLHGPDGKVSAILGVASDITEIEATRARLAAALEEQRAANAELERLNVAKSGIVSMLSHEFRTPLTSIQGYAELINGYPLDPEQVTDYSDEILRGVQRLAGLIEDVLQLDQVQSGNAEIARRPVALDGVLEDVTHLLAPQASAHEIRLEIEPGLPPVLGDEGRLTQVFTNLVGNAVKYSPDGGAVAVAARRDGDMAVVTVRDQGIGIPPDKLEEIFEPYVRLPEAKRLGVVGTGLGLPITRQLVEAMGGTVVARNVPGGSEFEVRLPLAR